MDTDGEGGRRGVNERRDVAAVRWIRTESQIGRQGKRKMISKTEYEEENRTMEQSRAEGRGRRKKVKRWKTPEAETMWEGGY
jgi:hypothetical protein